MSDTTSLGTPLLTARKVTPLRQRMIDDMTVRNRSGTSRHTAPAGLPRVASHVGLGNLLLLTTMMDRQQRIDYEILDHVLNAGQADGYATNSNAFTLRLQELFPFIEAQEFVDVCIRLHMEGQLELRRRDGLVYRPYLGGKKDPAFFTHTFYLCRAHLSRDYFEQLQRFIDVPAPPRAEVIDVQQGSYKKRKST